MKVSFVTYMLLAIYFLVGIGLLLGIMFEAKFFHTYDYVMGAVLFVLGICFVSASVQTFIRLRDK